MKSNQEDDMIAIFAGSSMEAEIVRSLLKYSEIEAFLKDEIMGTLAPWHTSPGGMGAVKVMVNGIDYERAKLIVEEYEQSKE